jgi:hypothetical protein
MSEFKVHSIEKWGDNVHGTTYYSVKILVGACIESVGVYVSIMDKRNYEENYESCEKIAGSLNNLANHAARRMHFKGY